MLFVWRFTENLLELVYKPIGLILNMLRIVIKLSIKLFIALIILQIFFSNFDYFNRKFQYLHHLYSIALLHLSLLDFVFQHKHPILNSACSIHIFYPRNLILHSRHLVEMSCKQTKRIDLSMKIFTNLPSYSKAFTCACSSAQLIYKHQRIFSGCIKHARTLKHLAHKSRNTFDLKIRGSNSSNDRIYNRSLKLDSRHETANMCKICTNPYSSYVS